MTPAAGNARLGLQPGIVWALGGGPLAAMRPKRDELRRELGAQREEDGGARHSILG